MKITTGAPASVERRQHLSRDRLRGQTAFLFFRAVAPDDVFGLGHDAIVIHRSAERRRLLESFRLFMMQSTSFGKRGTGFSQLRTELRDRRHPALRAMPASLRLARTSSTVRQPRQRSSWNFRPSTKKRCVALPSNASKSTPRANLPKTMTGLRRAPDGGTSNGGTQRHYRWRSAYCSRVR